MPKTKPPNVPPPNRQAALAAVLCLLALCLLAAPGASASRGIHGTAHLKNLFRHIQPAPDAERAVPLGAPPLRQVGHQRVFFAFDFKNQTEYTSRATLRAVGDRCYIYVENSQWNRRVTQRSVNALLNVFENRTAADSSRGIYEIEAEAFGAPPDIDGDPRIYLLLLDVKDGYSPPSGSFVAGYFSPVNQARGQVRDGRRGVVFHSNEIEMLYIDTNPLNPGGAEAFGIVAHELQHLIHYRYDANEETWLDEAASELAMSFCGYAPLDHVRAFEGDPTVSLVNWPSGLSSSLAQYGAAFLFAQYIYEHRGGMSAIRRIVQHSQNGMRSVESALRSGGRFETATQLYADWQTALASDDATYQGGKYGFKDLNVRIRPKRIWSLPTPTHTARIENWSSHFIEFRAPAGGSAPLQFELKAPKRRAGDFQVQAALLDGTRLRGVRSLQLSSAGGRVVGSFGEFGTSVNRIVISVGLAASSASGAAPAEYEYSGRIGEGVSFTTAGYINPVHPGFVEIAAVPSSPIEEDGLVVEISSEGETFEAEMRSADGGKSFGASIRAPADRREWRFQALHHGSVVGEGSF